MEIKKIINIMWLIVLLVASSATVQSLEIEVEVEKEFYLNDELSFDYSFFAENELDVIFVPYIHCSNAPDAIFQEKTVQLKANKIYTEKYKGFKVTPDIESQKCTAQISITRPYVETVSKGFSIITNPGFSFSINTCKDQACDEKAKIFAGEDIYLDYDSEIDSPVITATLTYPDKTTQEISLPTSIKPHQTGTYELEVTASKQGFKTITRKEQFGVIKKDAEIEFVGVCNANNICDGEETYQNCPWDCVAEFIVKQEKETSRIYTFFTILVLVMVAAALAYIEVMRLKTNKKEDLELKNYILNIVTKGFSKEQARNELRRSGWSDKSINRVLKELKKYNLDNIQESSIREKELQLKRYVFDMLNRGFTEDQVRKDLRLSGWPDKEINKIFNELRIYFPKKKK